MARPAPGADAETAPYWEALREERLTVQHCERCGTAQLYPRPWCKNCHGPVDWIDASGLGTVYSYTVIRQNYAKPFRDEIPYVVALIDLDEGARLMTNIVGADPADVSVGARVRVKIEPISDDASLPFFELAPDA